MIVREVAGQWKTNDLVYMLLHTAKLCFYVVFVVAKSFSDGMDKFFVYPIDNPVKMGWSSATQREHNA